MNAPRLDLRLNLSGLSSARESILQCAAPVPALCIPSTREADDARIASVASARAPLSRRGSRDVEDRQAASRPMRGPEMRGPETRALPAAPLTSRLADDPESSRLRAPHFFSRRGDSGGAQSVQSARSVRPATTLPAPPPLGSYLRALVSSREGAGGGRAPAKAKEPDIQAADPGRDPDPPAATHPSKGSPLPRPGAPKPPAEPCLRALQAAAHARTRAAQTSKQALEWERAAKIAKGLEKARRHELEEMTLALQAVKLATKDCQKAAVEGGKKAAAMQKQLLQAIKAAAVVLDCAALQAAAENELLVHGFSSAVDAETGGMATPASTISRHPPLSEADENGPSTYSHAKARSRLSPLLISPLAASRVDTENQAPGSDSAAVSSKLMSQLSAIVERLQDAERRMGPPLV